MEEQFLKGDLIPIRHMVFKVISFNIYRIVTGFQGLKVILLPSVQLLDHTILIGCVFEEGYLMRENSIVIPSVEYGNVFPVIILTLIG